MEGNLEFDLPTDKGFTIPITTKVIEGEFADTLSPIEPTPIKLFVYDTDTQTVRKREVMIAGLLENFVLAISDLEAVNGWHQQVSVS